MAAGVNTLREENPKMTILLITHYQRLLNYIKPDVVHVMVDGRIVRSGGPEVALDLEDQGYSDWKDQEFASGEQGVQKMPENEKQKIGMIDFRWTRIGVGVGTAMNQSKGEN